MRVREEERKVFTDTLEKIVEEIAPEKIICFGNRTDYHESWSNFLPAERTLYLTYYDILIATKEGDERKEHEILGKIEAYNNGPIHITALVHNIITVNKAILNGNPFFVTIYKKGMVVYDNKNIPLSIPDKELDEKKFASRIERDWSRLFGLAEVCYEKGNNTRWDQNEIALFMFHQAVEYACMAIIRYYTGYRPTTHNIKRLLSLVEIFVNEKIIMFSDEEVSKDINALFDVYKNMRCCRSSRSYVTTIVNTKSSVRKFLELVDKLYQDKKKLGQ